MIEPLLAGIGLAVCAVLLLRMLLPARQQRRLDNLAYGAWHALRRHALAAWSWREWRQRRKQATHEADAAIGRARAAATRDDKIIRPEAFKRPRKPH